MGSGSTSQDDQRDDMNEPRSVDCTPAGDDEGESVRVEPAEHDDRMGEEPGYGYGV